MSAWNRKRVLVQPGAPTNVEFKPPRAFRMSALCFHATSHDVLLNAIFTDRVAGMMPDAMVPSTFFHVDAFATRLDLPTAEERILVCLLNVGTFARAVDVEILDDDMQREHRLRQHERQAAALRSAMKVCEGCGKTFFDTNDSVRHCQACGGARAR